MNCILICLAGLYMEAGIGVLDKPSNELTAYMLDAGRPIVLYHGIEPYDLNVARNPRGRISIGHEWNLSPRYRVSFELRHESWIGTKRDRGNNGAWTSVRYLPWAK